MAAKNNSSKYSKSSSSGNRVKARETQAARKNQPRVTKRLSLFDRLSQLTYRAACRLLGTAGEARLREAASMNVGVHHITLLKDTLVAKFIAPEIVGGGVRVTIVEIDAFHATIKADYNCS